MAVLSSTTPQLVLMDNFTNLNDSTTQEYFGRDGFIPDYWYTIETVLHVSFFVQTPIGFVSNILAAVTATQLIAKGELTQSAATHIQVVAFWDFWSLFMDGLLDNMMAIMWMDLGAHSDFTCGLTTYLDWATSRAAILGLAISACDRCVSVMFPVFYRGMSKKKSFTLGVCAIYSIFIFTTNFPIFTLMDRAFDGSGCERNQSGGWVTYYIALVGSFGQLVGLPAVLIIMANSIVFFHLRVKKTRLSRRARSALAMVSASSIISLMMMMVAGWAITNDYVKLEDTNYTREKNTMSNSIYRMIAQMMIGMTNSTNFLIYMLSSSSFRSCFFNMVGMKTGKRSRDCPSSSERPPAGLDSRKESRPQHQQS
ncbi:cysteinyl leukotriene receptor 1-like [Symsagittifera roscoffensis]|uniref:cysteinyl leukotriene receptor 1-like n=1 Tax=Symsagittifera roscoffensis TaxID=84072 RepID=UPI00307C974B